MFRIFIHAWKMVFRDFGAVLKLSSPMIIYIVLEFVLFPLPLSLAGIGQHSFYPGANVPSVGASGPAPLVRLSWDVLGLVCAYWVAVAWHRYVLLNEYPDAVLPAFRGGRVLAYFGRAVLLTVVLVLPLIILGVVAVYLFGGRDGSVPVGLAALFVVAAVFSLWASMRLSMVFPAAAIGEPLGLAGAWAATRPISLRVFGLFGLFFGLGVVLGIGLVGMFLISPFVALAGMAAIQWFMMVLGLSVLTTLYGVYVEGREID